jgi:Ca2+-binding RTX toxin-like protein
MGNSGNNEIDGGAGNDKIDGGAGEDTCRFSDNNNEIDLNLTIIQDTGDGSDLLLGMENVDAGGGDDFIMGNSGNNEIEGGEGNDTIDGGAGIDGCDFSDVNNEIDLNLAIVQDTGDGLDLILGMENVDAGGGDDFITGNSSNNEIEGGEGDDTIDGGMGIDTCDFGDWNNIVNLTIDTEQNTGEGTDVIVGIENVDGGGGNDSITGNDLDNTIMGGSGNDTLNGGAGSDTASFGDNNNVVNLNINIAQNTGDGTDILMGCENADGGGGNDEILGNSGNNDISGGKGNDKIKGGNGNDKIKGGDRFDLVAFGNGNNKVDLSITTAQNTGEGSDVLSSCENVNAGGGNDSIMGNDANNVIAGGDGNDTIKGGKGNDAVSFGNGNNTVDLSITTTQVTGEGTDLITGVENVDGGAGNDFISGNTGNNILAGGEGDDTLTGGSGIDYLVGGNGKDTIACSYGQSTAGGMDKLFGLTVGQDRIDISVTTTVNVSIQSYTFVGNRTATNLTSLMQEVFADTNLTTAGSQMLGINSSAFVTWNNKSYLVVNNDTSGFQADSDVIMECSEPIGNFQTATVDTLFI